jgi:hypothetical protein
LSDPEAVEHLASAGVEVRVMIGSRTLSASRFHPKLYVVTSPSEVTVYSGSVRRSGEWDGYIAAAEARRALERQLKRIAPGRRSRRRTSALQRDLPALQQGRGLSSDEVATVFALAGE